MISDNYVTGDNIYLRELQNFFFEVLGMMSITHYGAVGNGRVDNYGPLQVAIDDANRRGLNFIYVPYGRFIYTGELQNIGDIIFLGNPHAHIVNIRTGTEIEIHQFGWIGDRYFSKEEIHEILSGNYAPVINEGKYIDLSGSVGEIADLTPLMGENKAYFTAYIRPGEVYDIIGDFTLAKLNPDTNEILYKYSAAVSTYEDRIYFKPEDTDGIFVVSFQNTDEIPPQLYHYYEHVTITDTINSISTNNEAAGAKAVYDYVDEMITDTINSSSTNNEAAGAKAVYDYIDEMITQAIGGGY